MRRFDATQLALRLAGDRPIVGNLGPTSDELWHAGHRDRNFYTYGNMGLVSSIGLGMALATDEQIICMDGDGSLLMNLGTLASIGRERPKNLIVLVYDNEAWGQTGHQLSHTGTGTSLEAAAQACGIGSATTVSDLEELEGALSTALESDGPHFIVAKIEEAGYLPVAPVEPEFTLYRFRNTFVQGQQPDRVSENYRLVVRREFQAPLERGNRVLFPRSEGDASQKRTRRVDHSRVPPAQADMGRSHLRVEAKGVLRRRANFLRISPVHRFRGPDLLCEPADGTRQLQMGVRVTGIRTDRQPGQLDGTLEQGLPLALADVVDAVNRQGLRGERKSPGSSERFADPGGFGEPPLGVGGLCLVNGSGVGAAGQRQDVRQCQTADKQDAGSIR